MDRFIRICSLINKSLCTVLLLSMVIIVFLNTALRYFLSSGIIITEELVRYLFLWSVYLGVIAVWYQRSHIRVTTITDKLKPRSRIKFFTVFEILSILVLGILAFGSYQYYFDTTTVGQVTGIPYSVMILSVLVGSACCLVISIGQIFKDLQLLKLSDEELDRIDKESKADNQ